MPDPAEPRGRAERRRDQFLLGRRLARDLLGPGAWQMVADEDGRPVVTDGSGAIGPDLSLSHSGVWAAAAIAQAGRVGIDIEVPRRGRDFRAIAECYFSPAEQCAIRTDGELAMLSFWTLREAVAKAVGGGMAVALSLDGTALARARDGSATIGVGGLDWAVAHRNCGGFQLALAWSGSGAAGSDAETAVVAALDAARSSIQSAS
jgi:4'-phosphopantetheinyl transferase